MKINGLLFDKDGTLFDFRTTWNSWAIDAMTELAGGDPNIMTALADVADFDLAAQSFRPTSPIIAGTHYEASALLASVIPTMSVDDMATYLTEKAQQVALSEVVPLRAYLLNLKSKGIAVGVMTNDSEEGARAHMSRANALDVLDFVAGFDSGYGGKPNPEPLLAFANKMNLDPHEVAMVGDSTHDLIAGKRAGMHTIGVLTGMAETSDLAPYADVVLGDIGEIPVFLGL